MSRYSDMFCLNINSINSRRNDGNITMATYFFLCSLSINVLHFKVLQTVTKAGKYIIKFGHVYKRTTHTFLCLNDPKMRDDGSCCKHQKQ